VNKSHFLSKVFFFYKESKNINIERGDQKNKKGKSHSEVDLKDMWSSLLSPTLGITKAIMSQGPHVLDMEFQESDDLSMALEDPSFLQCNPCINNISIHPTSLVLK
jgi:hypothetical protein